MPINKYDRFVNKDFGWKTYIPQLPQLDFEQMDQLLAGQQAKVDNLEQAKALIPNALQTDEDLRLQTEYKDLVNSGSQQVADAYMKSASAGNAAYKNYVNQIKKAWQPGGTADILNKRYTGYFEGKKAIDDYYKDETNPAFKQYAYDQLTKQVQAGPRYDPATGEYQTVQTPELFKNPNLRKTILDTIKEIDDSGDTQFLGPDKQHWIQKIQSTGKPEEKIRLITQALMSQPEFANELKVEQWYQSRGGQDKQIAAEYLAEQDAKVKAFDKRAIDAENGINTKDFQQFLVNNGYDVQPDGVFGKKTEAAARDFLNKQKQIAATNAADPDLASKAGRRKLEKSYMDYALGFANKKIVKDLIHDKTWEIQVKSANERARTSALLQLNDRLAPVADPDVLVTPAPAVNLTSTFDLLRDTKANKDTYEQTVSNVLTKNPNSIFNGWTMSNIAEAQRLFNEVPTVQNGAPLSNQERENLFAQKLRANSTFQFSPQQIKDVFNGIKTTDVTEQFEQLSAMDHSVKMLEEHTGGLAKTYVNTPEGKKAMSVLRSSVQNPVLKNLSDEDLAKEALANPEKFEIKYTSGGNPNAEISRVGNNPALQYRSVMEMDVPKLQKAGIEFKTDNAWAIHAGDKDKFLKPIYDNTINAINSQVEGTFSSEGLSGLVFRDMKGNVKDVKPKFTYGNVTVNADGNPVFRATGMTTKTNGKPGEMVSTEIALNDGNPISMKIRRGLEKELAQNAATQDWATVEGISKVLFAFDPKNRTQSYMEQETNLKDVRPQKLIMRDAGRLQNGDSEFTTSDALGFETKEIGSKTYGNRVYHTYVGKDLAGNKVFFNTYDRLDSDGNPTGQRIVKPLRNGEQYTRDVAEINAQNLSDYIISQTPVERDIKKIPEGVIHAITNFE